MFRSIVNVISDSSILPARSLSVSRRISTAPALSKQRPPFPMPPLSLSLFFLSLASLSLLSPSLFWPLLSASLFRSLPLPHPVLSPLPLSVCPSLPLRLGSDSPVLLFTQISQFVVARSETGEEAYFDVWEVIAEMAGRAASRGCNVPTQGVRACVSLLYCRCTYFFLVFSRCSCA